MGLKDLLSKVGKALDLANPELIRSLSPTEGLEVKPHAFQATEQEGRWKPAKEFGQSRALEPPPQARGRSPASAAAIPTTLTTGEFSRELADAFPRMKAHQAEILSIEVKAVGILQVPGLSDIVQATSGTTLGGYSIAKIGVRWWADGLEIWGGHAGLDAALGFGSLFGHRAFVELDGAVFGNYFPTRYLVTFAGWVNPMGPSFFEFAGGIVVGADGTVLPAFGTKWVRDAQRDQEDPYSRTSELDSSPPGYELSIDPGTDWL